MSDVLNGLALSTDPVDRELARTLRTYQEVRASRGKKRSIGYEPRHIKEYGAVGLIERRVRKQSAGFAEMPIEATYEAIVEKYPDFFAPDIVAIARKRLEEADLVRSTANPLELDEKVGRLLKSGEVPFPEGVRQPQRKEASSTVFLRDPLVKAFVLQQARGSCEYCSAVAPFKNLQGNDYLEVHHMRALAEGGSDRVQNAVALCPNCHRALHHAADASERRTRIYECVSRLEPE